MKYATLVIGMVLITIVLLALVGKSSVTHEGQRNEIPNSKGPARGQQEDPRE